MVFIGPEDHHDHPARDPRALRACFRRYWRWKSRPLGGRPQIDVDLRALIRQIGLIKSTNYVIAGIGFGESEKNARLQIRSAKYELRLIGYGLQSRIVKQSSVIACGHLFCGRLQGRRPVKMSPTSIFSRENVKIGSTYFCWNGVNAPAAFAGPSSLQTWARNGTYAMRTCARARLNIVSSHSALGSFE
jgi:hypothetical protein